MSESFGYPGLVSEETSPAADPRLGAILVRTAGLSLRNLQDALDQQKSSGEQLGAILRKLNLISAGQLLRALEIQSQMRQAAQKG